MNCLETTFYDFCLMLQEYKNDNDCFYTLLAQYLTSCKKCRLYYEKSLLDYKQKLDILDENNYTFIMNSFDEFFELTNEKETEKDNKNKIFYYYKALISKNLSVNIDKNSTCEEVFSYINMLDQ